MQDGFSRTTRPQKVIVVGAGMAGLVAAYELQRAGHEPVILEARSRVGGRVETMREPFAHGLYAEAGAMRLPREHKLVMAYVEKFGLTVSPFTMGNPQAFCHVNGRKHRLGEYFADPGLLGFDLTGAESGQTATQLWEQALGPITSSLAEKGEEAWPEITARYDEYSIRDFLCERGMTESAIELFGLMNGYEARMSSSFMDVILAEIGHSFTDVVRIDGGFDRLPNAFLPALQRHIRFGARMRALNQNDATVTITYETDAGLFQVTGDRAIITIPFSVLRHVEELQPFSHRKRKAIRQLTYDASAKVFLQCRRRFWEEDDGIFGGGSVTDLAIRNCFYPDHGRETGRGVMLASYTWGDDAARWASLHPQDRLQQAIENVAELHPQIVEEFETGASKVWHEDDCAAGAFALFDPGQKTQLYENIIAPEGRIHFAGEHASLHHRWILGAVESGLRAATEVQALVPD